MASLYELSDSTTSALHLGYNSDEEPPANKEDAKAYLRWQQEDAHEDSLSDWTIQVAVVANQPSESSSSSLSATMEEEGAVDNNNGQQEETNNVVIKNTYHVHRYALATGPRRSEYFARLFQHDGCFAESQNSTSRIELDELAATAFPSLLDFLYAPPHVLLQNAAPPYFFTTHNATALYSLAKYFDMPRLRWLAKQFWIQDIQSCKTCGIYYQHAKILQEHALLQVAIRAFGKHVLRDDSDNDDNVADARSNAGKLLKIMKSSTSSDDDDDISVSSASSSSLDPFKVRRHLLDAQFWQHYLPTVNMTTNNNNSNNLSLNLSLLLAEFFRSTSTSTTTTVTLDLLHEFTAPKYLPQIHVDAALILLDMEHKLTMAELQEQETTTTTAAATTCSNTELSLSSLQERCILALAQKWDCIDLDEEPNKTLLQNQSALVICKIYAASLATAKVDKQEISRERDRLLAKSHQQRANNNHHQRGGGGRGEEESSSSPFLFSFGNSARSAADVASGHRASSSYSNISGMHLRSSSHRQPRPASTSNSSEMRQRRPERVPPPPPHMRPPPAPAAPVPLPSHHWWLEARRLHDLSADRQVDYHDDDDTY